MVSGVVLSALVNVVSRTVLNMLMLLGIRSSMLVVSVNRQISRNVLKGGVLGSNRHNMAVVVVMLSVATINRRKARC